MSYGFAIYRANGKLMVSSDSYGGVLVEALYVVQNSGIITRWYSAFSGSRLKVLGGRLAMDGVSYQNGVPVLSLDSSQSGGYGQFFVFAI